MQDTKVNGPVLVWVTNPEAGDRIIQAGKKLADERGAEIYVVSIQNGAGEDPATRAIGLEMLHRAAKEVGAELAVIYTENQFHSAADTVKKIKPSVMVAGIPGSEGKSVFLDYIYTLGEDIPSYIVDKSGNMLRADALR